MSIGIGGNHAHAPQANAQDFGDNLRHHRVRALANVRRAGVHHHAAVAVDLEIDG